jgi:hypothetical protein
VSGKEVARITRFYAAALLILAFHKGAGKIPYAGFLSARATLALLIPALLLYFAAFIILKLAKRPVENA